MQNKFKISSDDEDLMAYPSKQEMDSALFHFHLHPCWVCEWGD